MDASYYDWSCMKATKNDGKAIPITLKDPLCCIILVLEIFLFMIPRSWRHVFSASFSYDTQKLLYNVYARNEIDTAVIQKEARIRQWTKLSRAWAEHPCWQLSYKETIIGSSWRPRRALCALLRSPLSRLLQRLLITHVKHLRTKLDLNASRPAIYATSKMNSYWT